MTAADEVGPASLLRRLEALERQHRRLKVAGAAVLALASVVLLIAAEALLAVRHERFRGPLWASRMIDAEGVVVRGPDGAVQAMLAAERGGTPRLRLFDADGTPRTTLSTDGLHLAGKGHKGGATVETDADGSARLALLGPDGRRAAWLGALADGSRALFLSDQDETSAAMLSVAADGGLRLILADKQHGQRANLSLPRAGAPHLDLSARDGKGGATLGVTTKGAPGLRLFDRDGQSGAVLIAAEGAAGLRLLDRGGKDVAGLVTDAGGWSRLFLSADGDKAGALLGVSSEGAPGLALFDQRGKPRAVLGQTSRRGELDNRGIFSLRLFNEAGKLLYRAPKF